MTTFELREKLNGRYKLTRQRELIFQILSSSAGHHLNVEDIYKMIRKQYPKIGLATIYRTIELFRTLDIVQKLDFGDGYQRYELNDTNSFHHHHFICSVCGKVIELKGNLAASLTAAMAAIAEFSILDYRLYMYGYCSDCRFKQNSMGFLDLPGQNAPSNSNLI